MGWLLSADLGIDLGSSEIRIYQRQKGLLLTEPTAVLKGTDKILAFGQEAKAVEAGELLFPIQNGVILDFELLLQMLQVYLRRAGFKKIGRQQRLVVLVPQQITGIQIKTVLDLCHSLGFQKIYLAASVMALALSNNLSAKGHLVIDLGRGRTDLAMVVSEGIAVGSSLEWGGQDLNQAVARKLMQDYSDLSPLAWEDWWASEERPALSISYQEIAQILEAVLLPLENEIREILRQSGPELVGDLWEKGLLLGGRGALVPNLSTYLGQALNLPVVLADPLQPIYGVEEIWKIIDRKPNFGLLSSWLQEAK